MKEYKRTTKKQLGELLIERGFISHEQLEKAILHQKNHPGLIGEILVELKFATEEEIAQALTCQYGFPYLPLANYEIEEDVLKTIPKDVCEKFTVVPVDKIGKSLTLAMSNPLNIQAIEDIELMTGCSVQAFVGTNTDIKNTIKKYYLSS